MTKLGYIKYFFFNNTTCEKFLILIFSSQLQQKTCMVTTIKYCDKLVSFAVASEHRDNIDPGPVFISTDIPCRALVSREIVYTSSIARQFMGHGSQLHASCVLTAYYPRTLSSINSNSAGQVTLDLLFFKGKQLLKTLSVKLKKIGEGWRNVSLVFLLKLCPFKKYHFSHALFDQSLRT